MYALVSARCAILCRRETESSRTGRSYFSRGQLRQTRHARRDHGFHGASCRSWVASETVQFCGMSSARCTPPHATPLCDFAACFARSTKFPPTAALDGHCVSDGSHSDLDFLPCPPPRYDPLYVVCLRQLRQNDGAGPKRAGLCFLVFSVSGLANRTDVIWGFHAHADGTKIDCAQKDLVVSSCPFVFHNCDSNIWTCFRSAKFCWWCPATLLPPGVTGPLFFATVARTRGEHCGVRNEKSNHKVGPPVRKKQPSGKQICFPGAFLKTKQKQISTNVTQRCLEQLNFHYVYSDGGVPWYFSDDPFVLPYYLFSLPEFALLGICSVFWSILGCIYIYIYIYIYLYMTVSGVFLEHVFCSPRRLQETS